MYSIKKKRKTKIYIRIEIYIYTYKVMRARERVRGCVYLHICIHTWLYATILYFLHRLFEVETVSTKMVNRSLIN